MSGAAFEGLEGAVRPEDSGSYTPGEQWFDPAALDAVIQPYTWGILPREWNIAVEMLRPLVEGDRVASPDAFLDAVVGRINSLEEGRHAGISRLLDPLVQALYDCGHNCFRLDLSDSHQWAWDLMSHLHGSEQRPLSVSCVVDIGKTFGLDTRYCSLELTGSCDEGGGGSEHSVFSFSGKVKTAGRKSASCSYTLDSARAIQCHALPCGSEVYVRDEPDEWHLDRLTKSGFFNSGNSLYVIGSDGSAREVRP